MPLTSISKGFDPSTFWSRMDKSGGPDACWVWTQYKCRDGYGKYGKKSTPAHRMAWFVTNGPIPDGMLVCHRCDNPPCCNPAHLFLGTVADNHRDMVQKGRHARGDTSGSRTCIESRPRGEGHGRAKLNNEAVADIRARATGGEATASLARSYGVGWSTVYGVVTGKTWCHLPSDA